MKPIDKLTALGNPTKAAEMAEYHKFERPYLGISNKDIYKLCAIWRAETDIAGRIEIAATLWDSNIYEARVAAAKLLTQARIRPDDEPAWQEICRWVTEFDSLAIADLVCTVGAKRVIADPTRIETLALWATDESMWMRRSALMMTMPWTRKKFLNEKDTAIREQILGWAAIYTTDHDWNIQSTVAWWLRSLSRQDPERVLAFIDENGEKMKPFAVKEALQYFN